MVWRAEKPHRRWGVTVTAAAVAGINLAVTVPRAVHYPFWQDEVGAARIVVAPSFQRALDLVTARENHPPGFYLLLWSLHRLGLSVVAGRAVSVAAAALLTAAVVVYAARFLPPVAAAFAGLAVALSWQVEMHGWELRPYALLALTSFACIVAVERAESLPTRRRLVQLTLVVAAGSMLHDYFVFAVATAGTWLVLRGRARTRVAAALVIGLAPLAVWAPRFLEQFRHRHYATLPGFSSDGAIRLYAELFERSVPHGAIALTGSALLLMLVVAGAAILWPDPGRGRLCALAAVCPLVAAVVLWAAGPHVFAARALVGVLPFAAICCAAALAALPRPAAVGALAVAAALVVAGFARGDGRIVPRYDRVADILVAEGWRPKDPLLLVGPLYAYLDPLDWYLPGDAPLAPAARIRGDCGRTFVVAVGTKGRSFERSGSRRIDGIVVAPTRWRAIAWRRLIRSGATVIGTREAPCLELRWGE
jgi:hypothetical protein